MNSTHNNCKLVVFSNKAYNAIINETFRKDPVETGGILLGHVLSNGYWIVMEVLPPGINAIHQRAYFEYDTEFVNYLANSISKQFKIELSVLGLWHRHPGSMDVFSGTDDGTNATFAQMNTYGAISGLVNIDPTFRFTLRHVAYPLHYQIVDFEVGDDLIPEQYFELKYAYGHDLRPSLPDNMNLGNNTVIREPEKSGNHNSNQGGNTSEGQVGTASGQENSETEDDDNEKRDISNNISNTRVHKSTFRKYLPIALIAVASMLFGAVIGGVTCSRRGKMESAPKGEDTLQANSVEKHQIEKDTIQKMQGIVADSNEGEPKSRPVDSTEAEGR